MAKKQKTAQQFVVCVSNKGCDDLLTWKLYRLLPDKAAQAEGYCRVVDESGEDYLYPSHRFVMVKFSPKIEKQLLTSALA